MPAVSQKQQKVMAIFPSVDPRYVAGFLDGEGNITILERNRYKGFSSYGLHVGFTNCNLRPLLAIRQTFGGCIFEKKRRSPKHSPAFELRISKRAETIHLLSVVLPYLLCKRPQAELGLAFLSLGRVPMIVVGRRRIHPTKGGSRPIMQAAPGEQEKRRDIKNQLMVLNARGA